MRKLGSPFRYAAWLFMAVLLCTSCSLFDDESEKKTDSEETAKKKEEDRFAFLRRDEKTPTTKVKPPALPDETGTEAIKPRVPVGDEKLRELESANRGRDTAKVDATVAKPFYEDFIALNGNEEIPVSLIFNSAPLLDVLSAFADILGFNFVADSDLKSVVTLNLNSTMTRREVWNTFDRMLYVAGAAARVDGSLIRIFARAKLASQPDQKAGHGIGNNILFFPLTTATAREAAIQIRPFLAPGAICTELTKPNAVLVCD